VIREEHDGTITVIASSFQGRRLNRPNDVVVKSDGAIYFHGSEGKRGPGPDRPLVSGRLPGLC